MRRLLFISRINLLAGRTNVYNFTKTCEALNSQRGFQATLVTTNQRRDKESFFQKMAINNGFEVVFLNAETSIEWLTLLWANFCLVIYLTRHMGKFDVIYLRDESLVPVAWWTKRILGKSVFFEIHSVLQSERRQLLNKIGIKISSGVIAISTGLKNYYQKFNKNILISLCSAAEDSWFDYSQDRYAFRKELGLPNDSFLIGYTGVVGANPNNDYYELDDIVKSLKSLSKEIILVIVGELNNNAEWLLEIAQENGVLERVVIVPWRERSEIPKYLQAFDISLIPKRKKDLIGDSPAKMFPALVARRPIVAGRAECIEEVLTNNSDALIVDTNTPEGWVKAILKIYNDRELAQSLSNQAWITKDKYTWEKRGIAISEFIKKTLT